MDELRILRHSLRRVAEVANEHGAKLTIPTDPTSQRGWNTLCLDLIEWLEYLQKQKNHWPIES